MGNPNHTRVGITNFYVRFYKSISGVHLQNSNLKLRVKKKKKTKNKKEKKTNKQKTKNTLLC